MSSRTLRTLPLVAAFIALPAFADYSGPGSVQTPNATIEQVLKKPVDDSHVTMDGYIVRKLPNSDDLYEFKDKAGKSITVEIDHDKWPAGTDIDHKKQVRINGEVDVDHSVTGETVTIDVDSVRLL